MDKMAILNENNFFADDGLLPPGIGGPGTSFLNFYLFLNNCVFESAA